MPPKKTKNTPAPRREPPQCVKDALRHCLDRRTKEAKSLDALSIGLHGDFDTTAKAILIEMASIQTVVVQGIRDCIMSNPDALVDEGRVSELVSKDFLKLQAETRHTLRLLNDIMQGKEFKPGEREVKGYADLVRELSDGTE